MRKSIEICCRYNYVIIPKKTIKTVLRANNWIFNDSWNFWSYCRGVPTFTTPQNIEGPIIGKTHLLFSSIIHDFDDWQDVIKWDYYGAWYSYNFPVQRPILKETLLLGKEWHLPTEISTNSPLTDYYSMGCEWQFLHDIRPDIFIIKNGRDVIVGSPDFYVTWRIRNNIR